MELLLLAELVQELVVLPRYMVAQPLKDFVVLHDEVLDVEEVCGVVPGLPDYTNCTSRRYQVGSQQNVFCIINPLCTCVLNMFLDTGVRHKVWKK